MENQENSQVSLSLPTRVVSSFDRIAQVLDKDRTWVMARALTRYLEQEGADLLDAQQGLEELDRGEGSDFDDMIDRAKAIIDEAEVRHLARFG